MTDSFYKQQHRPRLTKLQVLIKVVRTYYRTIIAFLGAIIIFAYYYRPFPRKKKTIQESFKAVWWTSIWFLLWLPIPVQAVGFIVLFLVPFLGFLSCENMLFAMYNEMFILMFAGSMLSMLFNCSGIDKRIACNLLRIEPLHTASSLTSRTMMAAFFLSVISNRLIVTCLLIDMVILPLDRLSEVQRAKKYTYILNKFDYESFKAFLCNAIVTSATIGSICIQHHNLTLMQFRAIFAVSGKKDKDYPDIFNYLMYSCYAFPTAILMFLFNYCYHMNVAARFTMSKRSVLHIRNNIKEIETTSVGAWDTHQRLSVFFFIVMMFCFMTRWCKWLDYGWATAQADWASPEVPGLKDATTASFFLVLLFLVPRSFDFFKNEFKVKCAGVMKPIKMESGLLYWRTCDFYTDYPMLFIFGSGLVILQVLRTTRLDKEIEKFCEYHELTEREHNFALLELLTVNVVGANLMNGIGWQAMLMPFVLISAKYADIYWIKRLYVLRTSLGVGIGSSFGYLAPFKHHPVYYSMKRAHVGRLNRIKYGIASMLICLIILWLTLCFYAPYLWDPDYKGVKEIPAAGITVPTTSTTTETPITTTKRKYFWWSDDLFG